MPSSHVAFFFFLLVLSVSGGKPTAYEALRQHGFPVGLLPEGVTGYKLDSATGQFSARLSGRCGFELHESSYKIKYEPTIGGVISDGKIEGLKGVSVRVPVLMVWLNVVQVVLSGPELRFSVGVVGSQGFPVDNFVECPRCGCGLDCNNSRGVADN